MNDDKLKRLITLGLDERTPDLEALASLRIAAKHFADGMLENPQGTTTHNRTVASLEGQVGRLIKETTQLEEQRDAARAEATKHQAEVERLRLIIGKMLALKDAEEKMAKTKSQVEREAREALGPPSKPRPFTVNSPDPFQSWPYYGFKTNGF